MLKGSFTEISPLTWCPGAEVFGGSKLDTANTVNEVPVDGHIVAMERIPESHIQRIESAISDDGILLELSPMDSIFRNQSNRDFPRSIPYYPNTLTANNGDGLEFFGYGG